MFSCLSYDDFKALYDNALDMGLEVLAEVHDEREIKLAKKIRADIIGINNRDIKELERDEGTVELTEKLASYAPNGSLLISESAISTPEDVSRAIRGGADAVLVGTAILKAQNTAAFYKSLMEEKL